MVKAAFVKIRASVRTAWSQASECLSVLVFAQNGLYYITVLVCANREGNGNVVGHLTAPNQLVVLNTSDVHFDPCLPL